MDNREQIAEAIKIGNTTESIVMDFAKRAVAAINGQLRIEIERNGFNIEDLKSGKAKLVRTVKHAESDPRFIGESYSIETTQKGKTVNRLIMCIKWSPNDYRIERNSEAVANAVKVNKNFLVKKSTPALVVGDMTQDEIDIEARASEYERQREAKEGLIYLKK